jgi:hydrogenase maturation protease
MSKKRILVAGIGNIFLGDDAFGCEVIRKWSPGALPEAVQVEDFGIRGYDLACALAEGYEAAVLVDALPRGQAPGSVFLFEPDLSGLGAAEAAVDPHSLDPVQVLRLAASLGALPQQLYLLGCEPAVLEPEAGALGLSEPVRAALPKAIEMLQALVEQLLGAERPGGFGGISPRPSGFTPR